MPWKIGGNFEAVAVTCENWQECVIAVANYLWCEMVSDVVEYFAKDGIIWVLAIVIVFTILIRIKYHRNMHVENIVLNKQILNKIEYKIRDLELKVNVLTYKVQYGTWPLPHQIYNLNPKKLQKIRMTLSNPGDRKNWIKHVLLSPTESNMCTLYPNTFTSKAKLPKFFDIKQKHIPHRLQCNKLSTECSSIEISKSISDQSVKMSLRRPRDPCPQNVNTKGSDLLSNNEDFTLQHQDIKVLPLVPDEINHQFLKIPSRQSGKCAMHSTNAKYSSCQKLTDTVYKCKSFFKNLKYKNNSRKTNEAPSLKTTCAKELTLFTMGKRNKSSNGRATAKRKRMNDGKYVTKIKDEDNKNTSANVATSNESAFPRKLVPIFPIIQAAHIVRSSRETLYKVRKRLHSLHNILETYQHMTQSLKGQESINQISEISDASTSVGPKIYGIKEVDENKTNTNRNSDSKENLQQVQSRRSIVNSCEDFEFDRLEGSLSSFAEYSSNTSKTCQYSSSVTSQHTYSKRFSQHNTRQKSVDTSDLPVLITEPYDYNQYSHFYRAMSQIPKDKTEREEDTRKYISNHNNNHELESRPKVNKDTIKTNILFNFEEKVSEVASKKVCYVLSPEPFKDKNTKTQNKTFLTKKFDTDELSDAFDAKQSEENISQNSSCSKILNNSETKEKSTALLLQEALHFKKILLTQSRKKCPINSMKQIDTANELPECETRINNNFPSMILDIKAEEPIVNYSHNRINQCYISLEMKQRRDLFSQSLQKVNTFPHHHRRDTEEQNRISKTPSEYFSITDLAIYKNDNIKNNVSMSSTPIYEKMISITMPNNVENQDEIDTNKSIQRKTVSKDIPNHVNSESLGENTCVDDIHNHIIDKYLSILKLEDLILEQVQNIREYMSTFLEDQNRTISKTCKELRRQDESDTFLRSNEQNHIILYNRSIASSGCNNVNRVASFSKDLPDLSINTWLKNDILERSPDTYLRKNPEMFALITPVQNTFSDKNDAQLKRKRIDLSLPIDSKSTLKVAKNQTPCSKECITPNTENDTLNKQTTVDVNVNFRKHGKQTQTIENGFSAISYFPLSNAEPDEN